MIPKFKLFAIPLVITAGILTGIIYAKRPGAGSPKLLPIAENVFLTSQLKPTDTRYLRKQGIRSVIDFRPDGEAEDQPSSSEIESATQSRGITFHYIPIPHETIPESAVDTLSRALFQEDTRPTVLYCRTGRRAVRTFALAEASRSNGPVIEELVEMVRAAGFSAEDLRERLAQRISQRNVPAAKN